MKLARTLTFTHALLVLAACGGSDGGDPSDTDQPRADARDTRTRQPSSDDRNASGAAAPAEPGTDPSTATPGTATDPGTATEPQILSTPSDPDLDTDGDGLTDQEEIEAFGTSPTVEDTDGDGFSDFDEVVTKSFDPNTAIAQFNPRVADVPRLRVELVSAPGLGLVHEEANGTVSTEGTERTQATSQATTHTSGGSNSRAVEMTHTAGVSLGVEHEFGPTGGTSVNAEVSYEFSHSTTNEETVSWSDEQMRENSEALARIESIEQSEETTLLGGYLQMAVRLRNEGHIAFAVEGVTLSAFTNDPAEPGQVGPLGTLTYLDSGNATVFPRTVIEPGDSLPPATFNLDLDLGTIKALLLDSRNLVISPATGAVTGTDGVDFGLSATNIAARTAQVIVDYGPDYDVESYRVAVATNTDRPVVSAERVFSEFLRVPFSTGAKSFVYGDEDSARPSKNGLLSVRGVKMSEEDSSYWIVSHTHSADNGARTVTDTHNLLLDDYDFESLTLAKGDVLHLVYVEDTDRDGLGNRAELLYGTSPSDADTDRDGLSDSTEVNGWLIDYEGQTDTFVTSDPLNRDSDGDGTADFDEYEDGTHPRISEIQNTPPTLTQPALDVAGFDVTLTASVEDPDDNVTELVVDWGDGSAPEVVADPVLGTVTLMHEYSGEGVFDVTLTASDALGETSQTMTGTVTTTLPVEALAMRVGFDESILTLMGPEAQNASALDRWVPDRFGNVAGALDLFGEGNRDEFSMLTSAMPVSNSDFTFAIWVNMDHPRSGPTRLLGQGAGFALFVPEGGGVAFGLTDYEHPDGTDFAKDPANAPEAWTFYVGVATQDGAQHSLELFRDGRSVATATVPFQGPSSCRFYVGHYVEGNHCTSTTVHQDAGFPGDVDDIRAYDRPLSVEEIEALYHEGGYGEVEAPVEAPVDPIEPPLLD